MITFHISKIPINLGKNFPAGRQAGNKHYPYYLSKLYLLTGVLDPKDTFRCVWYHFGFVYSWGSIITGFYLCCCSLTKNIAVLNILNPGQRRDREGTSSYYYKIVHPSNKHCKRVKKPKNVHPKILRTPCKLKKLSLILGCMLIRSPIVNIIPNPLFVFVMIQRNVNPSFADILKSKHLKRPVKRGLGKFDPGLVQLRQD